MWSSLKVSLCNNNGFCWSLPELLDEILALLDHIDGDLQRSLLLLAKAFDQILHGFHRFGVNVVQQLLLQLLQPCPQLQDILTDTGVFITIVKQINDVE